MSSYDKFGSPPPYGLTQPVQPFMHGTPNITAVNMPPPQMSSNVVVTAPKQDGECCCCCCSCPFWVCCLIFALLIAIPIIVTSSVK